MNDGLHNPIKVWHVVFAGLVLFALVILPGVFAQMRHNAEHPQAQESTVR